LIELARKQCKESHRTICGQVIYVPIVEAPGQTGIGPVRLERPARQFAVILRRCLPERDGHTGIAEIPRRLAIKNGALVKLGLGARENPAWCVGKATSSAFFSETFWPCHNETVSSVH